MSNLASRLDRVAEWWQHEAGDRLIGRVVERGEFFPKPDATTGQTYDAYATITVLVEEPGSTENGGEPIPAGVERIFGARRSIPRAEVERQNPQVGDAIGIVYRGVPADKSYHSYRVLVDRAARSEPVEGAAETEEGGDDAVPF
jgi:hypothetical protein